jgi:hypothetical protein
MKKMPAVVPVLPVKIKEMIIVLVARKDPILRTSTDFPAVLQGSEFQRLRSSAACRQNALCVPGLFGDDIDDAIYRIGAPDCSSRSANHLNSFKKLPGMEPVGLLRRRSFPRAGRKRTENSRTTSP